MQATSSKGKAIVLGGSGFLGSHVADALSKGGYDVTVFDVTESPYLRPEQKMVIGDVTDFDQVEKAIKGNKYVYNFAAIAEISAANANPILTLQINTLGTVNSLEAAKMHGVSRYLFSSSVYVHSRHGGIYRASKQAAERFIETYAEQGGPPFTILRYGTLYGRRTTETNRIHAMIKQALTSGKIVYPGDGDALRYFIHAEDAANLSVDVLRDEYANRHLVVAGQEKLRINEVVNMIREMMPKDIEIAFEKGEPEGHYELTPYAFTPEIGHKIVPSDSVDFGQGLLDCIAEQYIASDEVEEIATADMPSMRNEPDGS